MAIVAASLPGCELANAPRYKPDYDDDKLSEAMNYFYKLHLYEAPIDSNLMSHASKIAFRGNVTVYGAIPVAVAVMRKTKCLRADQDTQCPRPKPKVCPLDLLNQ